jgi:hypothetical protein
VIALRPTLTERGFTVPIACSAPSTHPGHEEADDEDDGDDGAGSTCVGVRNVFVPASKLDRWDGGIEDFP